jgi:hypothetical protein
MSEINEQAPERRRNPLAWIAIVVVGLILYVFFGGDRRDARVADNTRETLVVEETSFAEEAGSAENDAVSVISGSGASAAPAEEISALTSDGSSSEGTIERSLLLPPGMRAREYIGKLRAAGKPYPLQQAYEKAQKFQYEGSLADAHLLYFFTARENHLPAIMTMAQLSDPVLFKAENSLLDQADAIQAFKWYSKADELGQPAAADSIDKLRQWAETAAATGDAEARQLLLNIR